MPFEPNISKEEIQYLPLYSYDKEVVVIDSKESYNQIVPELFLDKILGFDTETKPSFKKGVANLKSVALLQLSNASKTFLFRLNKYELQPEVIQLLSNKSFIKVGVSIRDDVKSLRKLQNFEPKGFIELQSIVEAYGIEAFSLRKIAAIVLDIRISKAQQLSNWEADILTEKQIKYAATDSWISRKIYTKLLNSKKI
ncbi:MAG: 3'-5' exonuclease domain-containing protein 2 [Bacteroidales bacterium]|nr:3'-5' exonuclease domain-containing protein 2 [Bacteroidales bacterium]MDD4218192.1 3'-5' exonuclease domain-containing protein 2 [Bacteroidales bacterium]MDY0141423.1 3'-5' exonuclease [Bacteroidales bacterium]